MGYILSEDPTYITTYQGARSLIRKIDREDVYKRQHLLQQHYAVPREAPGARLDANVGGQVRLILLGRDSRRDHRGAVAVAHVVLHDKYGAHAALLAANDRAQVGVKYLLSLIHI